jgi:alcohol dehydrogenase class IV
MPTTLSGGEYSFGAGATNDRTRHKVSFAHPSMLPKLVILDPELCKSTPGSVWLSTGIRAVDHCVETICSIAPQPETDEVAATGLHRLLPELLKSAKDPESVDARLQSQLGVIDAMLAVSKGIPLGASHGIGHQLGPLGVGHGETSCILLPAVMKYNSSANAGQQAKVLEIFWNDRTVKACLEARGLGPGADLGDVLDVFIKELGLPRSLGEFGIDDRSTDQLAETSLKDRCCKTNPRPLTEAHQVAEILQMVK